VNVKKAVSLILLILACLLAAPSTKAQTESYYATLRMPALELYAPAEVTVSYVYTNNVSIQVNTLGPSLYEATTSPVMARFETQEFDTYTIFLRIQYSRPVEQTIQIGIFEGGRAAKSVEFDVNAEIIDIKFVVSVVQAPEYPTAEQIALAITEYFRNEILSLRGDLQSLTDTIQNSLVFASALAIISFAVSLVAIVAIFYMHRKTSELMEWGIRHQEEHRVKERGEK